MKDQVGIEPIVERVVGQVLDSHVAQLRTEIVRRVMEEIAAAPSPAESPSQNPSASGPAELARAVSEIQLGTSQREILRALLDTSARYATRVALFVVKGSHATGWQARGFSNSDALKDFALDEKLAAVSRAISERVVVSAPVADLDARFVSEFGAPASGEGRILPLILKDKVAALVYADSGADNVGQFDGGALELLVLSTSAWLEVVSLRKQAQQTQKEPASHADSHAAPAAAPSSAMQSGPAFNDPFAAHAPAFSSHAKSASGSAAAAAPAMIAPSIRAEAEPATAEPQSAAVEEENALPEPLPVVQAEPSAAPEPELAAAPAASAEDQEVHRKAQRFARLLVDEIKLYNQAKVAEGRKNKDLYDRLKEAIEKSRATYQKRYGNTVAASANYFQHEIIRSLAEDDLSIMGANFRH